MFRGIRRLQKSDKGKSPEDEYIELTEPGAGILGGDDTLVNQITSLEELVSKRTQELEEARARLTQLNTSEAHPDIPGEPVAEISVTADTGAEVTGEDGVDGLFVMPNQPGDEDKVAVKEEPKAEALDLNTTVTGVGEEEEAAEPEEPAEPTANEAADSFAGIFNSEEEEENPLLGLVSSLPDVNADELLQEAEEIYALIRQLRGE